MFVCIKSEMDSRVLLYPMLRCLKAHGSIAILTSNRQLRRLIESDEEGGFRNIRVIVEENGAADEIFSDYGISPGDFDFVIMDNIGAAEYDMCIVPLGSGNSESFDEDISLIRQEPNVKIVQFGTARSGKGVEIKKASARESKKGKSTEPDEDYDPASKFRDDADDPEKLLKAQIIGKAITFPSFQQIEDLEGAHIFYEVDRNLVEAIYEIFGQKLAVTKQDFIKEVRRKDESSGYIKSRKSARA